MWTSRPKALIYGSKTGLYYVLDRATGAPVTPIEERPVPASDVPGGRDESTRYGSIGLGYFGDETATNDGWAAFSGTSAAAPPIAANESEAPSGRSKRPATGRSRRKRA